MAHVQHPQVIPILQVTTNIVGKRPDADVGVRRHERCFPLHHDRVSIIIDERVRVLERRFCGEIFFAGSVFRGRAAVQYAKQELRADARVHE